jgi:hypothetical protein
MRSIRQGILESPPVRRFAEEKCRQIGLARWPFDITNFEVKDGRGRCWRLENGIAGWLRQGCNMPAETPMNSTIASGFPSCMSRVRFPSPAPVLSSFLPGRFCCRHRNEPSALFYIGRSFGSRRKNR